MSPPKCARCGKGRGKHGGYLGTRCPVEGQRHEFRLDSNYMPRVSVRRSPIARKARPRKQRKTGRAALARLADKLCGQIVRARGACEDCGRSAGVVLQWAHGFSRRYKAVRWRPINGFCLCSGCHFKHGLRPIEWDEWLRNAWGDLTYGELRRLALKNERVDLEATVASLRAEIARLEA